MTTKDNNEGNQNIVTDAYLQYVENTKGNGEKNDLKHQVSSNGKMQRRKQKPNKQFEHEITNKIQIWKGGKIKQKQISQVKYQRIFKISTKKVHKLKSN